MVPVSKHLKYVIKYGVKCKLPSALKKVPIILRKFG